jgi:hypothetical protein
MNFLVMLISLEMLFVNLYTSYTYSKKKYSPSVTWGILIHKNNHLFCYSSSPQPGLSKKQ